MVIREAKGPLRILKSLLSEGMNPYLQYSNGTVTIATPNSEKIEDYQKRVDTLLRLNATKVIGLEDLDADTEELHLMIWKSPASILALISFCTVFRGLEKAGLLSMSIAKLTAM